LPRYSALRSWLRRPATLPEAHHQPVYRLSNQQVPAVRWSIRRMRCCDPILAQARIRPIWEPRATRSLAFSWPAFVRAIFLRLTAHMCRNSSRPTRDLVRRMPASGFRTSSTRQRLLGQRPKGSRQIISVADRFAAGRRIFRQLGGHRRRICPGQLEPGSCRPVSQNRT
jgi:hypothetical protein